MLKVRKGGQVRPQSALIAIGVNMRGYREVLGFWIGDSETYGSWNDFLAWLKGRGLRRVDLVVSEQHGGLVKAVETQFQGVMWQRCQTHFTRNIMDACPKQLQSQLHSQLRVIWEAPDVETARQMLQRIMDILEQGFDDAVVVLNFPERYRETQRGSAQTRDLSASSLTLNRLSVCWGLCSWRKTKLGQPTGSISI